MLDLIDVCEEVGDLISGYLSSSERAQDLGEEEGCRFAAV